MNLPIEFPNGEIRLFDPSCGSGTIDRSYKKLILWEVEYQDGVVELSADDDEVIVFISYGSEEFYDEEYVEHICNGGAPAKKRINEIVEKWSIETGRTINWVKYGDYSYDLKACDFFVDNRFQWRPARGQEDWELNSADKLSRVG